MKLIPVGFKDYYDPLAGVDREPTPVWVRKYSAQYVRLADKRALAELGPVAALTTAAPAMLGDTLYYRAVLSVAGHPWPILVENSSWPWCKSPPPLNTTGSPRVAWSLEECRAHVRELYERSPYVRQRQAMLQHWAEEPKTGPFSNGPGQAHTWLTQKIPNTDELHRQLRSPVVFFMCQQEHLLVATDVPLAPFRVAEHLRPQQAWQNIDRYLGNEMAIQEDPPPLSDELRRDAHGFDEWSFKQPAPGHKKVRRRANKADKRRIE